LYRYSRFTVYDLKGDDVVENEVFDISEFKDFSVTLKNGNVDNMVEFVRR
jgi:hypothetical protein